MRIALTGTSSTGKTTLAHQLMATSAFTNIIPNLITEDARQLLRSLGHRSMDVMTPAELRQFQQLYLEKKIATEFQRSDYLVDRSYVDVAAYFLVRDSREMDTASVQSYVETCRVHALDYDLHFFLPYGRIPFKLDGYRSEDLAFHAAIDRQIQTLLEQWNIYTVRVSALDIGDRVREVLRVLSGHLERGV